MSAADYLRDSVAQEALAFLSLLLRVAHLHNVHITIAWPKCSTSWHGRTQLQDGNEPDSQHTNCGTWLIP